MKDTNAVNVYFLFLKINDNILSKVKQFHLNTKNL